VQRPDRGLGFVLRTDGCHSLARAVDLPGQLVSPFDGVMEDLDEGLNHHLEGGDVVVPDDDRPQVFAGEEGVDVHVVKDGSVKRRGGRVSGHQSVGPEFWPVAVYSHG
jgi:hypothetical protein